MASQRSLARIIAASATSGAKRKVRSAASTAGSSEAASAFATSTGRAAVKAYANKNVAGSGVPRSAQRAIRDTYAKALGAKGPTRSARQEDLKAILQKRRTDSETAAYGGAKASASGLVTQPQHHSSPIGIHLDLSNPLAPVQISRVGNTNVPTLSDVTKAVGKIANTKLPGTIPTTTTGPTKSPQEKVLGKPTIGDLSLAIPIGGEELAGSRLTGKAAEAIRGIGRAKKAAEGTGAVAKVAERGSLPGRVLGGPELEEPVSSVPKITRTIKTPRARVVSARAKVLGAPERAKAEANALKTSEGRLDAAFRAGKGAVRHPAVTALAAGTTADRTHVNLPGAKQADALVTGTARALRHEPKQTLWTTARALPGAITGPLALGASGVKSIEAGSTKPLTDEAKSQFEGAFWRKGPKKGLLEKMVGGDPEQVKRVVENQGGLALAVPLPALSRSHAFEAVKGRAVEGVGSARRAVASKASDTEIGKKLNAIRHIPAGEGGVGFAARRAIRKAVAVAKYRIDAKHELSAHRHTEGVLHSLAKTHRGDKTLRDAHKTFQTLMAHGIRDEKGAAFVREHSPVLEHDDQLRGALDFMDAHPQMWHSKHMKEAISRGEVAARGNPAARVGAGHRARVMEQAGLLRHADPKNRAYIDPVNMVPHAARQFTKATTREGAWEDVKALEKAGKTKQAKSLRAALDPYTRPGNSAESDVRKAYDDASLKEHVAAVDAGAKAAGLARATWTHHASVHHPGVGLEESGFQTPVGRKEHMRDSEAGLAAQGKLDRSLAAYVEGTLHMPHRRAAGKELMRHMAREHKITYTWNGKKIENGVVPNAEIYDAITSPKTKENPNGGQVDRRTAARLPLREVKNAEEDPFAPGAKDPGSILSDMEAGRIRHQEPAVLLHREAIKELKGQINNDHGPVINAANQISKGVSRSILFTPAWAAAQTVAEGIPLVMSHPELVLKGPHLIRESLKFQRDHPEEAAALDATAGVGHRSSRASALQTATDTGGGYGLSPEAFDKGGRALTHGSAWQALSDLGHLRTFGRFDIARQNAYRKVLADAQRDKQLRTWRTSLKSLVDEEGNISRKFSGRSREEMRLWLARDPAGQAAERRIAEHVDAVQGNWGAFTRYEKSVAPFTIFYPFYRYAIRWPLYTFPREHPITASIAYFLAQQNSNELEKIAGGKLANLQSYADPVYTTTNGKQAVLPGGSRVSPGQSAVQQAAASDSPGALIGAANPLVGLGITGLTGIGPFGTPVNGARGWAVIDQLMGLTPPGRILHPKSQDIASKAGLAKPIPPKSALAQAYEKLDPNRTERSIVNPALPQSAAKFKQENKLTTLLKIGHDNGSAAQDKVASDPTIPVPEGKKLVSDMKARSSRAHDELDALMKDLGLGKVNKKDFERYKNVRYP